MSYMYTNEFVKITKKWMKDGFVLVEIQSNNVFGQVITDVNDAVAAISKSQTNYILYNPTEAAPHHHWYCAYISNIREDLWEWKRYKSDCENKWFIAALNNEYTSIVSGEYQAKQLEELKLKQQKEQEKKERAQKREEAKKKRLEEMMTITVENYLQDPLGACQPIAEQLRKNTKTFRVVINNAIEVHLHRGRIEDNTAVVTATASFLGGFDKDNYKNNDIDCDKTTGWVDFDGDAFEDITDIMDHFIYDRINHYVFLAKTFNNFKKSEQSQLVEDNMILLQIEVEEKCK